MEQFGGVFTCDVADYTFAPNTSGPVALVLKHSTDITVAPLAPGWESDVILQQDGTGGRTVSWENVAWFGGEPEVDTDPNGQTMVHLFSPDGVSCYGGVVAGGGTVPQFGAYFLAFEAPAVGAGEFAFAEGEDFPISPTSYDLPIAGYINKKYAVPQMTYAPGPVVAETSSLLEVQTPTLVVDSWDIGLTLLVVSLDGTESGQLVGYTSIPTGESSATIATDTMSWDPFNGEDLTFVEGAITSTAGGIYAIIPCLYMSWD